MVNDNSFGVDVLLQAMFTQWVLAKETSPCLIPLGGVTFLTG